MVEQVILFLIYVAVVCAVVWLVIWVLGQLGIPLPAQVMKIAWVIAALVIILLLWRMLGPLLKLG